MAAAYICDRCGKTAKFPKIDAIGNFVQLANVDSKRYIRTNGFNGYDLCPDCMVELAVWLGDGKKGEE